VAILLLSATVQQRVVCAVVCVRLVPPLSLFSRFPPWCISGRWLYLARTIRVDHRRTFV